MGNTSFDLSVQNPGVPVFFFLRSVLRLNYSTDVKQHFKVLLALAHVLPVTGVLRAKGWAGQGRRGG